MPRPAIPATGRPWNALSAELEAAKAADYSWRRGRMAVYFYYLDEALHRVQQEAYKALGGKGGETGSTRVVKGTLLPGMVPPSSGRSISANDNSREAVALAA